MGGKRRQKYASGEGAEFLTRNKALRKLQLSLRDFRKICILKGIYPREPRHRARAQHGDTKIKTLYSKKDIRFLMHEPMIWRLREKRRHTLRINRAKSLKEFKELKILRRTYPKLKLDHIVKERYPTFVSALRDLDDCLTTCFLFSTFPFVNSLPRELPPICRRLTFEFLHIIILYRALRKVFISIKGYYFQAEIKGQTITWIMPHNFSFQPQNKKDVDFSLMSTFVEFYSVLLGFVNYKLYHGLNLYYPPQIVVSHKRIDDMVERENYLAERIACLNIPLARNKVNQGSVEDEVEIDQFDDGNDELAILKMKEEQQEIKRLKSLFKGLRVFINREVPRLPLVFTLRCFEAEVSWDKTVSIGSTFEETDESITHQIVDRPIMDKQYISRYYVQPQWVFDSVNARKLLPVEKYFVGVELPPHLSPFSDAQKFADEQYIPPEQLEILNGDENEAEEAPPEVDTSATLNEEKKKKKKKKKIAPVSEMNEDDSKADDNEVAEEKIETPEEKLARMKKKMKVHVGKAIRVDSTGLKKEEKDDMKLKERMVPNKYKSLYRSIMKAKAKRKKDKTVLVKKRQSLDQEKKNKSVA